MPRSFRERIRGGEKQFAPMVCLDSPEVVKPRIADGFTMIVGGVDTLFLGHAARAFCDALRS